MHRLALVATKELAVPHEVAVAEVVEGDEGSTPPG